jgi:hypothetical protein
MKKLAVALLLLAVPAVAGAQAAATQSPNLSDQQFLASDATFQSRALQSFVGFCVSTVLTESATTALHRQRVQFCQAVMGTVNGPANFKINIAEVAASNATVVSDATAGGGTPLTTGNVATQAPLVVDTDLNNAIAAAFNIFVGNSP